MSRAAGIARAAAPWIAAAAGALAYSSLFVDYWEEIAYRRIIRTAWLALALCAAAAAAAPLVARLRAGSWRTAAAAAFAALLAYAAVHNISEVQRPLFRDTARDHFGLSDLEILSAFTDGNLFYPHEAFLEEARRAIPEDAAVLYVGELRSDPVNYALYPRRVYSIPAMHAAGRLQIAEGWADRLDPLFDRKRDWTTNPKFGEEAVRREVERAIRERGIEWIVVVSIRDPHGSGFWRIGAAE